MMLVLMLITSDVLGKNSLTESALRCYNRLQRQPSTITLTQLHTTKQHCAYMYVVVN